MIIPFHANEEKLGKEVLEANMKLLNAINNQNWAVYQELCSVDLTCFEPEAQEHQITGLEFHKFFFPASPIESESVVSMASPHLRFVGDYTACMVTYTKMVQSNPKNFKVTTYQESRLWQLINGKWLNVHFHKSCRPAETNAKL
jgi:calcium/calmodulin-dependent protein kinase (CaM kinase) II